MSRLLLVRHGITEKYGHDRFWGSTDNPLSDAGIRQAEKLRERLAGENISAVYTSTLSRAGMTAEIATKRHGKGITALDELCECDFGAVEGMTFDQIAQKYPELARVLRDDETRACFPDGESFINMERRIRQFLGMLDKHSEEDTVLIVGHGSPLRIMICHLLGIDVKHWRQFRLDLASLSIVYQYRHGGILTLLNDVSHLE